MASVAKGLNSGQKIRIVIFNIFVDYQHRLLETRTSVTVVMLWLSSTTNYRIQDEVFFKSGWLVG